jgi:hypothetical protein
MRDVERTVEIKPSFPVEVTAVEDGRPPHVLICVHGIRDNAAWCNEAATIKGSFADTRFEIVCVTYPRLSSVSFILGRRKIREAVELDVLRQIQYIRKRYRKNMISILCHSSGTKIVFDLFSKIKFRIEWIFLCGSVCRLTDVGNLLANKSLTINRKIINDAATEDWWPIVAEALRPSLFQATGVYGFHRFPVVERMFKYKHGDGTHRSHIEKWVLTTIANGIPERTDVYDMGFKKHLPVYIRRSLILIVAVVLAVIIYGPLFFYHLAY